MKALHLEFNSNTTIVSINHDLKLQRLEAKNDSNTTIVSINHL